MEIERKKSKQGRDVPAMAGVTKPEKQDRRTKARERVQYFEKLFQLRSSEWEAEDAVEFYNTLKSADDPAYETVWKKVHEEMDSVIRNRAMNSMNLKNEGKDITNAAVTKFFVRIMNGPPIDRPERILAFIHAIAFNKFIDEYRHAQGVITMPTDMPVDKGEDEIPRITPDDMELSPEEYVSFLETTALFRKIMDWVFKQKEDCKLHMDYFLEVRNSTIYKNLRDLCTRRDLGYNTVYSNIRRCIQKLRSHPKYAEIADIADRLFASIDKKDSQKTTDLTGGSKGSAS